MELGGALWTVIDVLFVVALAGAIAYATFKWHSARNGRRLARQRDRATLRNYEEDG